MNLRPRSREEPDVNITPLIDVVFLLLIFFMVSTTFRKESELRIDLPEASRKPLPMNEQSHIEVAIDAGGHYFINGRALTDVEPQTLKKALTAIAGDDRSLPFVLRADARTPYQAVVTAMDVAGQLGFKNLVIPIDLIRNTSAEDR